MLPLVSIVIASRSRHDHLRRTLKELQRQDYRGGLEMVILDDASPESLKSVVDEVWPSAQFIRKEANVGQCACRNDGFRVAAGKYVLQLDDDAHPVKPDCISRAVELLEERPEIGILNCYSFNGPVFPPGGLPPIEPRYCISFHGCAAFFRGEALRKVDGYLNFLERHWEEEDISIRIMKAGWAVYFGSTFQVHHRLSGINRNAAWTWKYGVRNKLWGLLMYWPLHRLPVDMGWTFALAFWDAARLRRFGVLTEAIILFAKGVSHALTLRSPMDSTMMRRYDALRFGANLRTVAQFYHPPATGISGILRWFSGTWWNRPRERNCWDRRPGDIGSTETVKFAHEYQTRDTASKQ